MSTSDDVAYGEDRGGVLGMSAFEDGLWQAVMRTPTPGTRFRLTTSRNRCEFQRVTADRRTYTLTLWPVGNQHQFFIDHIDFQVNWTWHLICNNSTGQVLIDMTRRAVNGADTAASASSYDDVVEQVDVLFRDLMGDAYEGGPAPDRRASDQAPRRHRPTANVLMVRADALIAREKAVLDRNKATAFELGYRFVWEVPFYYDAEVIVMHQRCGTSRTTTLERIEGGEPCPNPYCSDEEPQHPLDDKEPRPRPRGIPRAIPRRALDPQMVAEAAQLGYAFVEGTPSNRSDCVSVRHLACGNVDSLSLREMLEERRCPHCTPPLDIDYDELDLCRISTHVLDHGVRLGLHAGDPATFSAVWAHRCHPCHTILVRYVYPDQTEHITEWSDDGYMEAAETWYSRH